MIFHSLTYLVFLVIVLATYWSLSLRGQTELTAEQAENVARIVRYRFDVPAENVVVTDQRGRTLFAGETAAHPDALASVDRQEFARAYESALEAKANKALSQAYGANKGYVTLASDWVKAWAVP